MSDQLSLFGEVEDGAGSPARGVDLAAHYAEAAVIAAALPSGVYLGTSSWSFPGWAGIVYSDNRPQSELAQEGLREYARHPLLSTVGIDRSYYAPLPIPDLVAYASQLPDGFRCCIKAPAGVTAFTLRDSGSTPQQNPDFLSLDRLASDLLEPLAAAFSAHTGPIILEFPPFARGMRLDPAVFLQRLDTFLGGLPDQFDYAIELRDRTLLTEDYRQLLAAHGVAHTYNYWSAMPMPGDQADVVPPEDLPFSVVRLLLKPGTWYEDQREAFRPFNRIIAPDEAMRRQVEQLARRTLARGRKIYILVNNKAEGSSPLTVVELAKRLRNKA
ncbi:MAG TPA: DUF72 domain-containing protein [Vicinamibacterales bacterium]|nr:DUF72 domain-containing protein [Vicinamibacterales bacterium]